MKRAGRLFDRITSWSNLVLAARRARRGKRRRPDAARFEHDVESELLWIQRELRAGAYRPGAYETFMIERPVRRLISAASYRDRVVHHALMNVLAPILERSFIADTYANLQGRGTHAALDRFTRFARRYKFLLKCDIKLYFPSVDHALLADLLTRRIKCTPTLELASHIIEASNPQEPSLFYFPGDDLFTPHERRKGLPIGNLTSQWFANLYLDPMDHFVCEQIRPGGYVRYVDDFVLFGDDKAALHEARRRLASFLAGWRLLLHPSKTFVTTTRSGCRFLGFVVRPHVRRLRSENVRAFRHRLPELFPQGLSAGPGTDSAARSVNAWVAHARHGSTFRLRKSLLGDFADGVRV